MYEGDLPSTVEIESVNAFLKHVETQGTLENVVVQGIDLTGEAAETALTSVSVEEAVFLGCRMSDTAKAYVRDSGGTIFPTFSGLPFNPYRGALYTPAELMEGYERGRPASWSETVDAQIYDYFSARRLDGRDAPVMDALAFRIHDHAIDDALRQLLASDDGDRRRVVGVMGGHRLSRDAETYRQVARIGWQLTRRGFFVVTGGGPGAMEAANLGAALAPYDASAVDAAVDVLAQVPHYEEAGYVDRAFAVRDRYPKRAESLAVPTWFYGHEPSNLFPSHVAKYFANSIREDGLLAIATHGVVYAPGSAGTIQEVFMDAAQNHYETFGAPSPMIFFDRAYWTETTPVYPLVETLADGTEYEDWLTVTDDVETVAGVIEDHASVREEVGA